MSELAIYAVLVREHEVMLRGYVMALVRDPVLADDITQEAFLRAFKRLDTLNKASSFAAWIRTIARNIATDEARRRGRESVLDPETVQGIEDMMQVFDDPVRGDAWEDRVHSVEACFEQLPDNLKEPCELYYLKSVPSEKIAEKLQIGLATLRKRLERARTAIKDCTAKELGMETSS